MRKVKMFARYPTRIIDDQWQEWLLDDNIWKVTELNVGIPIKYNDLAIGGSFNPADFAEHIGVMHHVPKMFNRPHVPQKVERAILDAELYCNRIHTKLRSRQVIAVIIATVNGSMIP